MNTNLQITTLVVAVMFSTGALAADITAKKQASSSTDFNMMIDANNSDRANLHQSINASTEAVATDEKQEAAAEKQKVFNFINVEVGVGETPSVVDRRFDSIGEARVVDLDINVDVEPSF